MKGEGKSEHRHIYKSPLPPSKANSESRCRHLDLDLSFSTGNCSIRFFSLLSCVCVCVCVLHSLDRGALPFTFVHILPFMHFTFIEQWKTAQCGSNTFQHSSYPLIHIQLGLTECVKCSTLME